VTFHGPIARQLFSDYTLKAFKQALFETSPLGEVASPPPFTPAEGKTEWENRVLTLVGGKAEGTITGGNLSLVTATLGTPFEIDTRGRILFLEDVGEEPYRVDRMLTQLWLSGKLVEAAGVVLGKFTDCRPSDYKPGYLNTLSVEEVLRTRLEPLKKPCIYGLMIGHIQDNATIPMGVCASLDADAGRLVIEEAAVV
jgi:muramoyltetrapeptide carboxypeptidase